jgi:hypothetical protein
MLHDTGLKQSRTYRLNRINKGCRDGGPNHERSEEAVRLLADAFVFEVS